jgi:anaerobic selenocysteine-containing dehydrogenase
MAHVLGLERLRAAVQPFTPDHVARTAGIAVDALRDATAAFARIGTRGIATTGTGTDMSADSNLAEHLVECLNVVCGRFVRAGEEIGNPGFIFHRAGRRAQVDPPTRSWERGPRTRTGGYGPIGGEMATGVLADEILKPGPGRIRAMINHGGNPAVTVPDQRKIVRALRSLDLLVSIEPFMTPTARLSHYVLPPKLGYERPDLPIFLFEPYMFPKPYTRYCDEHYVFWSLAKRLGVSLSTMGVPLDMDRPPTDDELLAIVARGAPLPFETIKSRPDGCYYDEGSELALPADPATAAQFDVMPEDVRADIGALAARAHDRDSGFSHLLSNRRNRHRFNSYGFAVTGLRRMLPRNLAYLNPRDMAERGLRNGDWIEITSDHGMIGAIAEADQDLRAGVVSMSHGFGGLPEDGDYLANGASANLLISTDRHRQGINGMPRMSGIPVNIRPTDGPPR